MKIQLNLSDKKTFGGVLIISAILLSIATVYAHVDDVTLHFIKNQQDKVHQQMMSGVAGNPWQYRILADWMVEYITRFLFDINVSAPKANAYIVFRFLQSLLIFLAAGIYYRKLGISPLANLAGLSVLMWSMSHSLYNSDLSLNVFFDILFYLIAAILIINGKHIWLPLLMLLAAFNRETSALIPVMLIAFVFFETNSMSKRKPAVVSAILGVIVFAVVFIGLRFYYGDQKFLTADGYYPGIGLFVLNLSRWVTWKEILVTLSVVPFLAIFAYPAWTRTLKIFFWVIVPVWFGIHFFAALVAESRLLLVPQALVFIPGMLMGLAGTKKDVQEDKAVNS